MRLDFPDLRADAYVQPEEGPFYFKCPESCGGHRIWYSDYTESWHISFICRFVFHYVTFCKDI